MIKYNIYIENELAIPVVIDTSDSLEDQEFFAGWQKFIDLLPFKPQVIEYTRLGYTPNIGDSWDGRNFINTSGLDFVTLPFSPMMIRYFALILNNKVVWIYGLPNTYENEALIAALLSDPEFRSE